MGNRGGILVAAGVLALLTGCSAAEPVAQTTPSTTTSAVSPVKPAPTSDAPALGPGPGSPPPTTPQPPPPHSPDKVTSACPFLGVTDISTAMAADLEERAVEAAPDTRSPNTVFRCDYIRRVGTGQAVDLYVTAVPGTGRFATVLAGWSRNCSGPATPITGVDGTARWCKAAGEGYAGDIMVLVVKKAHGESRVAALDLLPNREEVYTELARLLGDRL